MANLNTFKLLAIDQNKEDLASIAEALAQDKLEILTASEPENGFELFLQSGLALPSAASSTPHGSLQLHYN